MPISARLGKRITDSVAEKSKDDEGDVCRAFAQAAHEVGKPLGGDVLTAMIERDEPAARFDGAGRGDGV
jgi:hypothetical protein